MSLTLWSPESKHMRGGQWLLSGQFRCSASLVILNHTTSRDTVCPTSVQTLGGYARYRPGPAGPVGQVTPGPAGPVGQVAQWPRLAQSPVWPSLSDGTDWGFRKDKIFGRW